MLWSRQNSRADSGLSGYNGSVVVCWGALSQHANEVLTVIAVPIVVLNQVFTR